MTQDWPRLFSASGFRWQIGLRPGDAPAFFAATPEHREILKTRAELLDESPADYAALLEAGCPLLEETARFAADAGALSSAEGHSIESLGRALEPDFVLLRPSAEGLLVVGGVVCFPSSWALPEKLGRALHETHAPVPGLNSQLGERIRTALDRLPPGGAWARENWGLARDGDRNHHPKRARRSLDASIGPGDVWLRIERQILYHLPQTGGLLFGIRLEIMRWEQLAQIEDAMHAFRGGLETMSDEIAAYKGLLTARETILGWLPK